MIYAKALTDDDRSNSIVVSFDSAWRQKVLDATFSVIIRKRIPVSVNPSWIYFHINAPFSELCARAKIKSIRTISKQDAVELHKKMDLSVGEIRAYLGNATEVGAYSVADFEYASNNITTRALQDRMIYSPPQSFLFLSHEGKAVVDRLCDFRPLSKSKQG